MFHKLLFLIITINLTTNFHCVLGDSKSEIRKQTKLPACKACKTFVESFKKGYERTSKGKFEGGDTDWEEKKLGSYATSEIRLTEIQEKLCSDVKEGSDQCYTLLDQYDSVLEDWWFTKQKAEPDLYNYICIDTFKQCCPTGHYGESCLPCQGFPGNVCNNNGACKGAGTRKGNGKCMCDGGYSGEQCDTCAETHFVSYKDDTKIMCSKCHVACFGGCSKAGAVGCTNCNAGWIFDNEKGCLDVNECASAKSPCSQSQFCVNNEGSYRCLDCDKSCQGCSGDGPDMCIRCAQGFIMQNNICTDEEQEGRKQHIFFTRYLTYVGLCIATCIICNKNVALAACIGVLVAVYIAVSEYVLNTPPIPKTDNIAEKLMEVLN